MFTLILKSPTVAIVAAIAIVAIGSFFVLKSIFERLLQQERRQLAAIVESSKDAILSTSVEGKILSWNSAAVKLLGYLPEEVKGRHISLLTPEVQTEDPFNLGKNIDGLETFWVTKEGECVELSLTISLIQNMSGEITGLAIVARDIRESKQLERELEKEQEFLRVLLESVQEGIVACDAEGKLTFFNQATVNFHGLPQKPISSDFWAEYYDLYQRDGKTRMPKEEIPLFKALQGESFSNIEMVIAPTQGARRTLLATGQALFDRAGNKVGAMVSMHDITQQQQAEKSLKKLNQSLETKVKQRTAEIENANKELQESTARFTSLVSNLLGAIYRCRDDQDWTIVYMSAPIEAITGYPASDFVNNRVRSFSSIIHPDDRESVETTVHQSIEQNQAYTIEFRIIHADGTLRWLSDRGQRVFNQHENITYLDGVLFDITQSKLAADKLKESEERFRLIVEGIKEYAIFMIDTQGFIKSWNPGAERIFGYTASEISHKSLSCLLPLEEVIGGQPEREMAVAATQGKYQREAWRIKKDGSKFWANITLSALKDESGNLRGFAKIIRDMTEKKIAEDKVKESEERFRLLIEGVKDYAIYMLDPNGYVISWNTGAERIKGYKASEIIGKHFSRFYFDEDVQAGHPDYELMISEAQGRYEEEGWRVRKDGSVFLANVIITALKKEDGTVRGFSHITRDITARKQDEEKLRKWADVFENTGQGLLVTGPGNKNLDLMNPAFAKMHGYTVEKLTGMPIESILAPEAVEETFRQIELSWEAEEYTFETQHIRKNGTIFPVLINATNVRGLEGKIVYSIVTVQDITQIKQAEAEIYKALERERELNELKSRFISMTSHEFRTPLATILSSSDLLRYYSHKLPPEEKESLFQQIENAIQRMKQLLEDVLAINKSEAGKLQFDPKPIDLKAFCQDVIAEMQLNAGEKYNIAYAHSGDCSLCAVDEKLLRHALTNLLSNAIKYSPHGGLITFNTNCKSNEVVFNIEDSGIGIPVEDQKQLFESFHRATNVGNIPGTGLGLSIVKRMVDLHRGKISVKSEVGVGTSFIVTIPYARGDQNNDQNSRY